MVLHDDVCLITLADHASYINLRGEAFSKVP